MLIMAKKYLVLSEQIPNQLLISDVGFRNKSYNREFIICNSQFVNPIDLLNLISVANITLFNIADWSTF